MQKFAFSLKTFHRFHIKGKVLQIGMIFAFVLEFIRTVQKSDICLASNNSFETALYNNTFLNAHYPEQLCFLSNINLSRYLHEITLILFQLCLCVVMIHKSIK